MNDAPLVTIVIANYNYGQFLETAIQSVLQQCEAPVRDVQGRGRLPIKSAGGDAIELIICDAASSDNSKDVIEKYSSALTWWCSEKDSGQSEAFNKGFRHGSGRYVTWLNADEEYLPGTLLALSKLVHRKPNAKWITGNMLMFDADSRNITRITWGPHVQPIYLRGNHACIDVFGPSSFVRRDIYDMVGPINEAFHYSMDLEYWARLTMRGIRQTRLNHICWAFAVHGQSKSHGSMSMDQIEKGHAENVARAEVIGYTYKTSFKNFWYVLWLVGRVLDFSLIVKQFKKLQLIGHKFYGCMNAHPIEDTIPLLYKDRREDGGSLLQRCKLVEMHLLYVLDKICQKHDIPYFLAFGTLLGAMRHDGFIPWDDDIDVGMRKKDFLRFLRIARRELPKDVWLQAPGDVPSSGYCFAKLRDNYSFYYEPHSRVPTWEHSGIYIDIFPYEDCPRIPDWMRRKIGWLASSFFEHKKDSLKEIGDHHILLGMYYYAKALFFAVAHMSIRFIWRLLQLALPSENVTHLLEFWDRKLCFPKSWIGVMPRHKFEDGMFPIPNHPEEILTQEYGDWRTLPPEDQRSVHMTFVDPVNASHHKWAMKYPKKDWQ